MIVTDRASLLVALEVSSDLDLEDGLHAAAELEVCVEWEDEPPGIILRIVDRGTIVSFPFSLVELWAAVEELDGEVTTDLEAEADEEEGQEESGGASGAGHAQ